MKPWVPERQDSFPTERNHPHSQHSYLFLFHFMDAVNCVTFLYFLDILGHWGPCLQHLDQCVLTSDVTIGGTLFSDPRLHFWFPHDFITFPHCGVFTFTTSSNSSRINPPPPSLSNVSGGFYWGKAMSPVGFIEGLLGSNTRIWNASWLTKAKLH